MADQQENEIGEWTIDTSNTSSETVKSSSVSSTFKVLGRKDAPDGTGVLGHNTTTTGVSYGVEGVTDAAKAGAAGVRGEAAASNGDIFGVEGITQSSNLAAAGVKAHAPNGARGVIADADSATAVFGNSVSGKGVWGISDSSTAARFQTNTGTEAALVWNQSSTGTNRYGLKAQTDSAGTDSAGVRGEATQGSGQTYGIHGETKSVEQDAAGVKAEARNGLSNGIVARARNGGHGIDTSTDANSNYALWGRHVGSSGGSNDHAVVGETFTDADGVAGVKGTDGFEGTSRSYGVKGKLFSSGTGAAGVRGEATQGSGKTYGVEGVTKSTRGDAAGVRASAPNGNADGITATGSTGVIATGRTSGVFAESTSTDPGFAAVTAVANNGADAVAANGRLSVSYSDTDALAKNPENYPAYFENTADTTGNVVLGVDCGNTGTPGASNNFIQFLSPDGSGGLSTHGNVEGNGSGGVVYETSGADYAEYMPRLDADEDIEAADVVGIVGDGITRNTMDAQRALVVTGEPAVTGNSPGSTEGERWDHETVTFTGQVPVKVRGSVNAGALIVPSGEHDGTGVAVTPEEWTPGTPVVGQAWEGDEDDEVSEVTVAVGIDDPAVVGDALASQQERIDNLEGSVEELERENEQLRKANGRLRERVSALETQVGTSPATADD